MQFFRLAFLGLVACVLIAGRSVSAQTNTVTNVVTLCTENDLIFAFENGGEYFMDCGTNIVSIPISEPLIATANITIRTTNEVVVTGQNLTRIMVIRPGVQVTLEGFAFFSGRQTETNENNGGIDDTAGGAIYNDRGSLQVLRGRFQANSVVGITGAAGEDGTGDAGEAGGDAAGAAIYNNEGTVMVSNVVFQANTATGGVGGQGGSGRESGFGDNGGNGGAGGSAAGSAIYSNGGEVFVFASTFTNNTATGAAAGAGGAAGGLLGVPGQPGEAGDGIGAAVTGEDAVLTILGSTFVTNTVRGANALNGNDGVNRNDGDSGLSGGDASGGAIYSTGKLWLTNSTFFRNAATSGNGGDGGAGASGGFGYSGGDGGNGGVAAGGAVESRGEAAIVNCTFAENGVTGGDGGEGGPGSGLGESGDDGAEGPELGGAVFGSVAEVVLANSILANSRSSIDGTVLDRGGNITTDRNPLIISTNSFKGANPFLQPLANNGGPTPTMRILTNSFAVDRGIAEFCVPIDQRGTDRFGRCDIGAFEVWPALQPIPNDVFGTNGLTINQTNNLVTLRWPAGYTNLFLEVTTNLKVTNTVWTTITNPAVTVSNNFNLFSIRPEARLPFSLYRLRGLTNSTSTNGGFPPFPPFPTL